MEEVDLKFIASQIKTEENVIPKTEIEIDFNKQLKKEIYNDVNSRQDMHSDCLVHTKIKLETGFCGDHDFETSSDLTLCTERVSSNISEKLTVTEDQLGCCQEKQPEKTLPENMQHVQNIISPSNLESLQSCAARAYIPICDICSATFAIRSHLDVHKRRHTREKPFKCNICSAAFASRSHLTEHTRRHTGEKPFKCNICSTAFAGSSNLTVHKRKHTGEKPFKCDICSVAFASRSHLNVHKRRHTGEKPFKCDFCSAAYFKRSCLTEHKRRHTGEKPFI